ncbi:MAG: TPM domain-containing protein [Sphingobacteriales bacterium]|nr:MAG: TPM domain-containing protein [Sphingobacteriales bacterium]
MFPFKKKKDLLDNDDQDRIVAAIKAAENRTTGELRIYMESRCAYVDAMDRAVEVFAELGMHKTERRNAVIVYLALEDHQFAIFGDEQIYKLAGGHLFWENAAMHLKNYLRQGKVAEGLEVCINELGNAMAQHFPYDPTIIHNELPDEIVFGK